MVTNTDQTLESLILWNTALHDAAPSIPHLKSQMTDIAGIYELN